MNGLTLLVLHNKAFRSLAIDSPHSLGLSSTSPFEHDVTSPLVHWPQQKQGFVLEYSCESTTNFVVGPTRIHMQYTTGQDRILEKAALRNLKPLIQSLGIIAEIAS